MRDNKGFMCHTHRAHVSYVGHHVWPLGYHGPDIKANIVKICPNAHSDIHYLMDRMLAGKPYNWREYSHAIYRLALEGYKEVSAYADKLAAQLEKKTS
jgi:hypothetical protein